MGVRAILDTAEPLGELRRGSRRFWTGREELILRNTYPTGGLEAAMSKLPGRTASGIYQRARALDLSSPIESKRGLPRQRYTNNDGLDALIRRTYETKPDKGAVKALARQTGRPRHWIRARALTLGCVVPRFKAPPWRDAEKAIVLDNAHKRPATIQKLLKRAGFERTEAAIAVMIKRSGADTQDPDHFTARGLASVMGIDGSVVAAWITKGWLAAKRRGTERTAAQGGDQWWIHRRDVRRFIVDNAAVVDIRKADKFWLIDLLAGRGE